MSFNINFNQGTETCGLCQQYYLKSSPKYRSCKNCPLIDEENSGCNDNSQFDLAVETDDKSIFMKARRNIIRRMQRALKRLETEEK